MRTKKQIDPEIVREKASKGLTMKQIADYLHITDRTLRNRFKEDEELLDAFEQGQAEGIETIANKLFELASNGNLGAIQFYLKSRAGWSDKPEKSQPETATEQPRIIFVNDLNEYEEKFGQDKNGGEKTVFLDNIPN